MLQLVLAGVFWAMFVGKISVGIAPFLALFLWLWSSYNLKINQFLTGIPIFTFLGVWASGGMIGSEIMSVLVVFGLVLIYFSIFIIHKILVPKLTNFWQTLLFPSLFVLADWVSAFLNPYGNWTILAHSQYQNKELIQFLSVFGVWGISFLVAWSGSVIVFFINTKSKIALIYPLILVLVLGFGGIRLSQKSQNNFVQITSISGKSLLQLFENSLQNDNSKIVFWAEASGYVDQNKMPEIIEQSKNIAKTRKIYFFPTFWINNLDKQLPTNKVLGFDPDGNQILDYIKYRPIPGEGVQKGKDLPKNIEIKIGQETLKLAVAICFDNDFVEIINQIDADILLQPSQDWAAIDPKHTHNLSFRAIENGFSTIKQTNYGINQATDYYGNILAKTSTKTMISQVPI